MSFYIKRYKHDCSDCRFLGTVQGPHPRMATTIPPHVVYDLYVCERADGGSVIARYGSEGSHYSSTPLSLLSSHSNPALLWAAALLQMEHEVKRSI